jgi:hypothetical protein
MKHYCERCERELDDAKIVWLEYDRRDGTYHDFGDIPAEHNQGGFAFGFACASRERAVARKVRQKGKLA